MSWYDRAVDRLFGRLIQSRVDLAVKVVDDEYWRDVGHGRSQDRPAHQRERDLKEYLRIWRENPLCRRMVAIVTDYVLGDGLTISSEHKQTEGWCKKFWQHPQNHMDTRLPEWCNELTRAGELFIVLSRNRMDGMSYVRLITADWIDQVDTDPDDLERELRYHERPVGVGDEGRWWPAAESGSEADQVVLHVAINKAAGCVRGESDLSPVLAWLDHYARWLEDRVRVNRLKSAFVWDVTLTGATPQAIAKRKADLAGPPSPGSVMVHNEGETWNAAQPKIDAGAVEADGKAIRLIAAAGMGIPLHFLSEGESATRATAQQMGDPTFRHFRRRQREICDICVRLLRVAYNRAVQIGKARPLGMLEVVMEAPEIVQDDNESLGRAVRMTAEALKTMHGQGWVDNKTAAAMAFKAAGEIVDEDKLVHILSAASAEIAREKAEEAKRVEAVAAAAAAKSKETGSDERGSAGSAASAGSAG